MFDLRGERREKKYSKEVILRGCEYALKYYERVYNKNFYKKQFFIFKNNDLYKYDMINI